MTSKELYELFFQFAFKCNQLIKRLPYNVSNKEYGIQLIRSSASPGANYIEAIEAVSKKDFVHRLRICRKESKESIHWLMLLEKTNNKEIEDEVKELILEAESFVRILTSSILTAERNQKMENGK